MAFLGRLVTSRRTRGRTRWRTLNPRLGLWRHLLEGLVTSGPCVALVVQHISRSMHLRFPLRCPFYAKKKLSRWISKLGCSGVHITRLRGQNSVCYRAWSNAPQRQTRVRIIPVQTALQVTVRLTEKAHHPLGKRNHHLQYDTWIVQENPNSICLGRKATSSRIVATSGFYNTEW